MRSKSRLPLALSGTVFFLSISIGLSGCGEALLKTETTVQPLKPDQVGQVNRLEPAALTLSNAGHTVSLDDPAESVWQGGYARPEKSTAFSQLPSSLDSAFKADGWETVDRTVATIATQNRLVLIMDSSERLTQQEAAELVAPVVARLGEASAVVGEAMAGYRFWFNGNESVMIAVNPDRQGRRTVTFALGIRSVMGALRMTPEHATEDLATAAALRAKPD